MRLLKPHYMVCKEVFLSVVLVLIVDDKKTADWNSITEQVFIVFPSQKSHYTKYRINDYYFFTLYKKKIITFLIALKKIINFHYWKKCFEELEYCYFFKAALKNYVDPRDHL